ncbi:unnamed protein product [Darwinula stevensoni]|uniref:Uncharacterized protein n=1 Tax=Darwinula stevensoni TaxID=69355 RepID=A0A7R9FRF3_9CRUS|nr:unnamed protein product [Darwinula stevensoni]CAG0901211.1 unnamed protein product [Darwinula stevensoni]
MIKFGDCQENDAKLRQKDGASSNGLHESEVLPVNDGEAVATAIAFKQLENGKKGLEASNQKMANELAIEKIEKAQLEKDLKESKDKIEELLLELRTIEEKAKDLGEQLKKEQNAYRGIERDKRTIENKLKESSDQVSYPSHFQHMDLSTPNGAKNPSRNVL